jgi:hypothetical protein
MVDEQNLAIVNDKDEKARAKMRILDKQSVFPFPASKSQISGSSRLRKTFVNFVATVRSIDEPADSWVCELRTFDEKWR